MTTNKVDEHLNAREIVEILDRFIKARVMQCVQNHVTIGPDDKGPLPDVEVDYPRMEEAIELHKRAITDYLLSTDPRQGVFVQGKDPIIGSAKN